VTHTRWALRVVAAAAGLAVCGFATLTALAATSGWLALDGSMRFIAASGGTVDWANSGTGSTGTCPGGAVDLGGTGGIFNCGQATGLTTPPIAPTLTPAAAADSSIISAVFAVDPLSSDTVPCAAGDPTTISGKNGDPINSYTVTAGSIPTKTDLANVYAVSHTRMDNGRPEIFFAAERLVNNGESHIDFEFLQSTLGLGGGCGTRFLTGSRTEGDLLVAVDFTIGGSLAGASIYEWHCVPEPGPQPPDGTVCNPPAANPSPPEHYEVITDPALLAAVTVLVNGSDVPCGGWVCRDQTGASIATVPMNDFLEGGIDLNTLGFKGCFNTFLPHTRASQSFTALLEDFTGPVAFHSCRTPAMASTSAPGGSAVAPGASATDSVTVGNGGADPVPTGNVTFFLCGPAQVTGSGCSSGGVQVGAAKPLVAGAATSDPTTATSSPGKYCWRTVYAPDVASTGVFVGATHTNATSECFTVAAPAPPGPGLPNTGVPASRPLPALVPGAILAVLLPAVAWRRSRGLSLLVIAGLVVGASPTPEQLHSTAAVASAVQVEHDRLSDPPHAQSMPLPGVVPKALQPRGWRLVIERIGVDALIEPVGLDKDGAMAGPSSLDTVGWFSRGPAPGQAGDAVIDGHYGLPSTPAVFRNLDRLRPGDTLQVIWPDGRRLQFQIETAAILSANSPPPPGVFTRAGPARLSLITCVGRWEQSQRTYSQRLIVTAQLLS
jgi:hypothetical protein